jgi:hypothetical protein
MGTCAPLQEKRSGVVPEASAQMAASGSANQRKGSDSVALEFSVTAMSSRR